MSITLVDIKTRVAVIESNRFAAADGLLVWQSLAGKADKEDVPPAWFLNEFNRLRDDFYELKDKIE